MAAYLNSDAASTAIHEDGAPTRATKRLEIAVISINYFPEPTGISVYSTGMAEYLAAQGHHVAAYTAFSYYPAWRKSEADQGRIFGSETINDVKLRRSYIYVPAVPSALSRIIHELSFALSTTFRYAIGRAADVTIVVSPPLLLGTLVGLVAKLKGSRLLLHVQDLQPDAAVDLGMLKPGILTGLLYHLERANYAMADRISTISIAMQRRIEAKGKLQGRTQLFRNWAEDDLIQEGNVDSDFRNEWQLGSKFVVLYAGNMGVKQGLGSLLSVAHRLMQKEKFMFVIVGDGGEKEMLQAFASARKLTNVVFKAPVPRAQLGALLAMADVSVITQKAGVDDIVLPSKLGNLLAVGKPVVVAATHQSELAAIVRGSRCGLVCPPEDDKAMADALIYLSQSETSRNAMGQAGQKYARDYLGKANILDAFAASLGELVEKEKPAASRTSAQAHRGDCKGAAPNKFGVASGWPLKTIARRVLWAPFKLLFLRGTTRFLSPLRVAALRLFGAKLADDVLICDGVKVWYPWNLTMGHGSTLGPAVEVYNFAPVTIGVDAAVSQYSYLCTASHDYTNLRMPLTYRPIVIGDHAWVAAGSFIGPGVKVGDGAVVGARSVVTRDVSAWMVVAGNPAKALKARRLATSSPTAANDA